jgi:hypothetical protein
MSKINFRRWLLAGLVAGVLIDIIGYLVDGVWLKTAWQSGMPSLGLSGFAPNVWAWFNVLGVVNGLMAMWIYAAIRPRFGAGVNTAFKAAVVTWVIGSLIPNVTYMVFGGFLSHTLASYVTLGAFVEFMVGTIAGAAIYREPATPPPPAVAAEPAKA